MQVYKTDIKVHRGETFSMDFVLANQDGSPYVFSSKAQNPYFLLTIASTKYEQGGRFVRNYWLKIPEQFLFYCTNSVKIDSFESAPVINDEAYTGDLSKYAIYYVEDADGNKTYKRWTGTEAGYVDYEMRIVKTFTTDETDKLPGQNYVYSINYVDGTSTRKSLKTEYEQLYGDTTELSNKEYYDKLLEKTDKFKGINWERELISINISIPIISPSKLTIINDIEGGIYRGE